MSKTQISWTDETANWIVGCSKISPGCRSCYAAAAANSARLQQFDQYKAVVDGHGDWNNQIEFVPKVLDQLLKGKRSRRVFAPSMSDPFHPGVKDEWLDQFMVTVALTPHITYQILTKRPERMLEYFSKFQDWQTHLGEAGEWASDMAYLACDKNWRKFTVSDGAECSSDETYEELIRAISLGYFQNLHLGVTAENQAAANDRIPLVLQTPAAARFVSIEPMLEKMDISLLSSLLKCKNCGEVQHAMTPTCTSCGFWHDSESYGAANLDISQYIIGGESGPNARPFHLEWAQLLIKQCREAGTKVFMKQVGSNAFYQGKPFKTKSRAGSDPSEWPEWARAQEFPEENHEQ